MDAPASSKVSCLLILHPINELSTITHIRAARVYDQGIFAGIETLYMEVFRRLLCLLATSISIKNCNVSFYSWLL